MDEPRAEDLPAGRRREHRRHPRWTRSWGDGRSPRSGRAGTGCWTSAGTRWGQPVQGLFFLAANAELPLAFVQALLAMGWRPVPLSGGANQKIVDIAIQRTIEAIASPGRRRHAGHPRRRLPAAARGAAAPRAAGWAWSASRSSATGASRPWPTAAWSSSTWSPTSLAFNVTLPRIRIIPIDEFDPLDFL